MRFVVLAPQSIQQQLWVTIAICFCSNIQKQNKTKQQNSNAIEPLHFSSS